MGLCIFTYVVRRQLFGIRYSNTRWSRIIKFLCSRADNLALYLEMAVHCTGEVDFFISF